MIEWYGSKDAFLSAANNPISKETINCVESLKLARSFDGWGAIRQCYLKLLQKC